ncbi:MAG: hypothetical protein ABI321_13770, partial [Polyangia bacterium]
MHNVSRRVLLLPLAAVSLGACATTHTVAPAPAPTPRIVASRCHVRERGLAPSSRHPRLAELTSLANGLAI